MTHIEIVQTIERGEAVFWLSHNFPVEKQNDRFRIRCKLNNHQIDLADPSGTLNGYEDEFFVKTTQENNQ
jgi:hypothetical protein